MLRKKRKLLRKISSSSSSDSDSSSSDSSSVTTKKRIILKSVNSIKNKKKNKNDDNSLSNSSSSCIKFISGKNKKKANTKKIKSKNTKTTDKIMSYKSKNKIDDLLSSSDSNSDTDNGNCNRKDINETSNNNLDINKSNIISNNSKVIGDININKANDYKLIQKQVINSTTNTNFSHNSKNNKMNDIEIIDLKNETLFIYIPSRELENIPYLKLNHPLLFVKDTVVRFKVYELSNGFPKISDYLLGCIINFNTETKALLVRLNINNSKDINTNKDFINGLMDLYDGEKTDNGFLINVFLKDLIEISIFRENKNNENQNFNGCLNNYTNTMVEKEESNISKKEDLNESNNKNNCCYDTNGKNIAETNINTSYNNIEVLKKQMLFYFSPDYYKGNSFLKSKEDVEGCKLILN